MTGRTFSSYAVLRVFFCITIVASFPFASAYATSTTTSVTTSQTTITVGDTVTFTATVTAGSGTPTGLVTFADGAVPLGSGTLQLVSGRTQATFSTALLSFLQSTPHSITATYQGDGTFGSSTSSSIGITVQLRNTTTALGPSLTSVVVGEANTAIVAVTDRGSASPPGIHDTFSTTGAPATARTGFTATLFADGLVLVAGGTGAGNNVLQSAEIYSVPRAGFTPTGNLHTARTGAAAVLLPNGKVLIAGGSSDGAAAGALNTAELFDPVSGTFTATSHSMTAARLEMTATLLNNGQVLLAGGQNAGGVLNSAELYDPASDTFTSTGNLNTARTGAIAVLLRNSEVLIAGGSSDGAANGALDSAELFGISAGTGSFSLLLSTLSTPRWQAAAAPLQGFVVDNVLIAGGQNSGGALSSGDVFDLRVLKFHSVSNQMTQARTNGAAIPMSNGKVLLAGGAGGSEQVDLYDFGANKFDSTSSLLQTNSGLGGALLNNGQVLVVSLTDAGTPASDAELYSPSFEPMGGVLLSSSESSDSFGAACSLAFSSSTISTCKTTVTPANVATSLHTITATYQAFFIHNTSNITASFMVTPAPTSMEVASSGSPSVFGQPVIFTAVVTDGSAGSTATPTGAVQFIVDGVNLGSPVALTGASSNSSMANQSTASLSVAGSPHTVVANYLNADGNFIDSSGALTSSQTVRAATTSTAIASSLNPSNFGQSVTFTATITDTFTGSTAAPSGSVQFVVDGTNFGSPVALTGAGTTSSTASTATSTLAVTGSPHTVAANYVNADGNFGASNSTLNPGQSVSATNTSVVVTSSAGTIALGDTVTLTATVTPASGAGTPTGLVTFFDGAKPLGSGTLSVAGGNDQATFSTSALFSGIHSISAAYDGDANFAASAPSQPIIQTVQGRKFTSSLVLNPAAVVVGQTSTGTITVTDQGASFPPGTPDTFVNTGAPTTGRSGFILIPFSDHEVLIAGGKDANGNMLQSAEIYNASTASFTATGNLNIARTGALAVLLPNGKVLVAGGSSDGTANGALNTAELFNPVTGTFVTAGQNMTAARVGATINLLNNGQVLLAGGENSGGVLNSAELYNPATDTFTATGNLNMARTGAAAAQDLALILIAGGSSDGTANGALASVETFNPALGTFTLSGSRLSAPRWQAEAVVAPGASVRSSIVLIAGGQNSTGVLTSADRFVDLFFSRVSNQMAVGRANGSAIGLSNGKVLFAGGAGNSQVAELYDPGANQFEATGSLLHPDNGSEITLLNDGRVLEVGLTSGATPASDAELYTPSFNPFGLMLLGSSETSDRSGNCSLLPSTTTSSTCSLSVTPVNVGANPHVLTANIGATTDLTVNPAATTASVASSGNPTSFGQPVTFTATVTDSSAGSTAVPTGAVQFVVDGANFGSPVPLTQATSTSSTATLSPALNASTSAHSITANYVNADNNFTNSNALLTGGQTVNAAATATVVVSSLPSSTYGQALNFTVTVINAAIGSPVAPTGSVQFVVDGQNFGAPMALAAGSGNTSTASSASTSALTVNGGSPHTVAVNYLNADKNFTNSGGSLSGGETIAPAHLTVQTFPQAKIYDGAPFTGFTTVLLGFVNGEVEDGLRNSGALSGMPGLTGPAVTAVNAGQYTIIPTIGTLAARNYDFPAANFDSNTLTIAKANTINATTVLASPINDPANGGIVSFTAVVRSTTGGTPSGSVQFTDDKNNLTALVPLAVSSCPQGTAATVSCAGFSPAAGQLAAGSQAITAGYQGDLNFNGGVSSAEVTVISAINTSAGQAIPPQTIAFENAAAFTGQTINLTCAVQAAAIPASPQFPTCSLSSSVLPADGTFIVNLSTVAATSASLTGAPATAAYGHSLAAAVLGLPAIGLLGLVLFAERRGGRQSERWVQKLPGFILMLSALLLILGCGGGSMPPPPPPPSHGATPSGTYLVSITGADANRNQIVVATIPLNVK